MLRDSIESKPQRLLVTIFGDYLEHIAGPIHSQTLVEFIQGHGYSENVGRVALSRMSKQGLLERSQSGRFTGYSLTDTCKNYLEEGTIRLREFSEKKSWDGTWTLVAFTVQESEKNRRHALRTALRTQGFAPLFDGLWGSPAAPASRAHRALEEVGVETSIVFSDAAAQVNGSLSTLTQAWHSDTLKQAYEAFIAEFGPAASTYDRMTPEEAFTFRTLVMESWRRFPLMDVGLPDELLPADWPRSSAQYIFDTLYSGLEGNAREHFISALNERPW